jgi:hypothetical protein
MTKAMMQQYTSRPVEEILRDLYALKLRERDGEEIQQPSITLLLGSNDAPVRGFLPVRGYLNDLKDEPSEKSVAFQIESTNDMMFVNTFTVKGIVVHDADRNAHLLVNLLPAEVPRDTVVSRLDVKERLAEEIARLSKYFGPIPIHFEYGIPYDPTELYFSRQFLTDLVMTLIRIGKTVTSKRVIGQNVKQITICPGLKLGIVFQNNTLVISYSFLESYSTNQQRRVLFDVLFASLQFTPGL